MPSLVWPDCSIKRGRLDFSLQSKGSSHYIGYLSLGNACQNILWCPHHFIHYKLHTTNWKEGQPFKCIYSYSTIDIWPKVFSQNRKGLGKGESLMQLFLTIRRKQIFPLSLSKEKGNEYMNSINQQTLKITKSFIAYWLIEFTCWNWLIDVYTLFILPILQVH